jgi:spermidine/putrescine transport system permease protein
MATSVAAPEQVGLATLSQAKRRRRRPSARLVLPAFTVVAIGYLMIPIVIMIIFSFNDYQGKFNFVWHGFTLNAWLHPLDWQGLPKAIQTSLTIAFLSTIFSTILGTLIGLALTRYQFRGRGFVNGLIFLPMATPEIVMGSSLLTLFISISFNRGFTTILIAHIMFNISYVIVTVKARVYGFDRRLEEAAMDLFANEWTTFRKVTLPLIAPAILAALLLCFAISIDDFVVTYFNSGNRITFPLFVWGAARIGAPPQVNVIGTAIFGVAVICMITNVLVQMRRERSAAAAA